jgi:hypothetical protein
VTFKKESQTTSAKHEIQLVRGDPDCAAFFAWIQAELNAATAHWPPPIKKLTTGRRGNLGEYLSYNVVKTSGLYGKSKGYTIAIMGALTPLQDGAPTGLDTTIVYLDPSGDKDKDCLFIIEVKTTGSVKLTYAKALVNDYEKLLGTTKVAGSLGQRMNWLQAYLREVHEFSIEELERVGNLFQPMPKDCKGVKLMPTLVHDRSCGDKLAIDTLMSVAQEIESLGWRKRNIEPWSIAMNKLTDCLIHLSNNLPFKP